MDLKNYYLIKYWSSEGIELIIADEKEPLALAGIMGGSSFSVTKSHQQIAIELNTSCKDFNPIKIESGINW